MFGKSSGAGKLTGARRALEAARDRDDMDAYVQANAEFDRALAEADGPGFRQFLEDRREDSR